MKKIRRKLLPKSLISRTLTCNISATDRGGGALECQGGYQARPKIHVIRVVFQDQALYARVHCLGVQKCAKVEKRVCFWSH